MPKKHAADPEAYRRMTEALDGPDPGQWQVHVTVSMQAREGYAYNANIFRNGSLVGTARNEGNGGMTFVEIRDAEAMGALEAWANVQPYNIGTTVIAHDAESFVATLAEISMEARRLKRTAARKTVFAEDGKLFTTNMDAAAAVAKYPNAVILNDVLRGGVA